MQVHRGNEGIITQHVNIVGGGLAGCEAAYYLARHGSAVRLWEMRPVKNTPVHRSDRLAELVCSNSLKSEIETTAQGLLKIEMRHLGSLLLECAEEARVPAGSALAVDRDLFADLVSERIKSQPGIEVIRQEAVNLPEDEINIVATGPLTSDHFAGYLKTLTGEDSFYFYDAIAPSLTLESLNMSKVYKASRYGKGGDDYYNCPMNQDEYQHFYEELIAADIKEGHDIDHSHYFDSCMPVEVIARRGRDTLRYGPMRPVGLNKPDGTRPYAVVQLRQEDQEGRIYGLVGFQTRIKWGEQNRILHLIPGLEEAVFVRYGSMHRNTYINSPQLLEPTLQMKGRPGLFFAGQITGVEGYMESAATGILAGINAGRLLSEQQPMVVSQHTMLGALVNFITSARPNAFQPVNANFGILPPLSDTIKNKNERYLAYVERAKRAVDKFSELLLKEL